MGFFSDIFGGGDQTTTVTPTMPKYLWGRAEPFMDAIEANVGGGINAQTYPGQQVAGFTGLEQQGRNAMANYANRGARNVHNMGASGVQDLLNPSGGIGVAPGLRTNLNQLMATGGMSRGSPFESLMYGDMSPYFQDVLRGGVNDMARQYGDITTDIRDRAKDAIFQSDDSALLSGNYGGSAQGTGRYQVADQFAKAQGRADTALGENMQQLYGDVLNNQFSDARNAQLGAFNTVTGARTNAANTAAKLYGIDETTGLESRVQGLNYLPTLNQLGMFPGSTMATLGEGGRMMNQQQMDANLNNWNTQNLTLPYYNMDKYAGYMSPLLTGAPAGNTTTQDTGSTLNNMIGTGLMGYGMYNSFNNMGGGGSNNGVGGYVNPMMMAGMML